MRLSIANRFLQTRIARILHQSPEGLEGMDSKPFYAALSYDRIPSVNVDGLAVELLPFQKEGIGWMVSREKFASGGIMADHLGMGKTLQMIGLCLAAEAVKQKEIEYQSGIQNIGYRLLTILRQMHHIEILRNCSKLNKPAEDIHILGKKIHDQLQSQESDFSWTKNEVEKWIKFAEKYHPAYSKRASAFLNDTQSRAMDMIDTKELRTLVIVPAALLLQWESEIKKKVAANRNLNVYIFHGASKNISSAQLESFDFVLTTYDTATNGAARPTLGRSDKTKFHCSGVTLVETIHRCVLPHVWEEGPRELHASHSGSLLVHDVEKGAQVNVQYTFEAQHHEGCHCRLYQEQQEGVQTL